MNQKNLIEKCKINEDAIETYPWAEKGDIEHIVIRHKSNNKWFGLIFHLNNELCINLKIPPDLIPILKDQYKAVKPAWHMNKKHWCTVIVNEIQEEVLDNLIRISFDITTPKRKHHKEDC